MGDVYLARHPRLPRSDALKLMSEELSRNEVYRQRFSAEADIASQIQHDSVVRVYDRGEDDGRLWLAMEYIDGRDLADILAAEGRLPPERAVALVERVAAGLDAIHSRGLLHRDVKPANILVARDVLGDERALLTDFGIARSAADSLGLTGVGDIVATLHYAAPEQFELRSGELDRRVDVYALGCVLYEMLTGRVPLMGDSVAAFWQRDAVRDPTAAEPLGQPESRPVSTTCWRRRSASDARIATAPPANWPGPRGDALTSHARTPARFAGPQQPPCAADAPAARRRSVSNRAPPPGSSRAGWVPGSGVRSRRRSSRPTEAQRLSWLISASNVYTLPTRSPAAGDRVRR